MGAFCDRLKFGSTAARDCRTGQNKDRYCKKRAIIATRLVAWDNQPLMQWKSPWGDILYFHVGQKRLCLSPSILFGTKVINLKYCKHLNKSYTFLFSWLDLMVCQGSGENLAGVWFTYVIYLYVIYLICDLPICDLPNMWFTYMCFT